MKKFMIVLTAAVLLLPVSCSKENGTGDEPMASGEYEYSGKMIVTAAGTDNVSENVEVNVILYTKSGKLDIEFEGVKFVPQMPVTLDVTVPGVDYVEKNGRVEFSGDGVIPLSGGVVPFPNYTVTSLSGTLDKSRISMKLNFGEYPVSYEGIPDR